MLFHGHSGTVNLSLGNINLGVNESLRHNRHQNVGQRNHDESTSNKDGTNHLKLQRGTPSVQNGAACFIKQLGQGTKNLGYSPVL